MDQAKAENQTQACRGENMTTYTVAFYEIDRSYGGPEEGGWYYDHGQLRRIARTFKQEAAAFAFARRANHILDLIQRHHRPVGSAAYDGGRFIADVYDCPPPAYFPTTRPTYE